MKKKLLALTLAVLMLCSALPMTAFAAEADDLSAVGIASGTTGSCKWTLDSKGNLTISGKGSMDNYSCYTDLSGYYHDLPWGSDIVTVTIKKGVTNIGSMAFYYCEKLKSVKIPDSVTEIGNEAFVKCESLKSISIPNSVKSIGYEAFWKCKNLKSIKIPDSVTIIDDEAFLGCESLKTITLSSNLESIGVSAFEGCESLKSVTIPKKVTELKEKVFCECTNLESVTLHDKVVIIGTEAFEYCTNLSSVTIPAGIRSIGKDAFYGCPYLTLYGYKNTAAGRYAKENDIPLEKPQPTLSEPVLSKPENKVLGIKVSWRKVTGAVKYRVYRKAGSAKKWTKVKDTTSLSYTDKNVTSGKKYTYTVRCISKDGSRFTSGYNKTGKSVTFIAAPANPTLKNTKAGVSISWKKVTGAKTYRVFRRTSSGSWKKLTDTKNLSFVDKTAKSGKEYRYVVRCVSENGKSYLSDFRSGTVIKRRK